MSENGQPPVLIGFYGFKGGSGRTVTAAHMAHLYSRMGRRVLLVDADLEAPGLSFWREPAPGESDEGLLQLLVYLDSVAVEDISESTVSPYIRSADDFFASERQGWIATRDQALGDVHLLPAGLGPSPGALDKYIDRLPHAHDAVVRAAAKLRAALSASGYDVVLVDSRPGLHPIGAALFEELTDYNVALFGPSRQAQRGLLTALDMFSPEQLCKIIFAMSPVAWSAGQRLKEAQAALRRKIGTHSEEWQNIVTISWHPSLAMDEQLITVTDPTSATARDYKKLFLELETLRGFGIAQYTKAVDALLDIFKASVAVDGPQCGLDHLRDTFKAEGENAFPDADASTLASVAGYLNSLGSDTPWGRRELIIELLVWEIIRRLRRLAQLDTDAAEALWAIVIRRNVTDPTERPVGPLKPMEQRYETLYKTYSDADQSLPGLLNCLYEEYRNQFGRPLRDHGFLPGPEHGRPGFADSVQTFVNWVVRL